MLRRQRLAETQPSEASLHDVRDGAESGNSMARGSYSIGAGGFHIGVRRTSSGAQRGERGGHGLVAPAAPVTGSDRRSRPGQARQKGFAASHCASREVMPISSSRWLSISARRVRWFARICQTRSVPNTVDGARATEPSSPRSPPNEGVEWIATAERWSSTYQFSLSESCADSRPFQGPERLAGEAGL